VRRNADRSGANGAAQVESLRFLYPRRQPMSAFSPLDDLTQRLAALIAATPAADVEKNLRTLLAQSLTRLDLVPREEFEVQRALLQRALERQAALEARLAEIEARNEAAAQRPTAG